MNDTSKSLTKLRVLNAMKDESLSNKKAAEAIGIPSNYLSMIKNSKMWPKCPAKAWEAALKWVNSGQTLKEYAVKHGKVRPDPESQPVEEPHPPQEPVIKVKPEVIRKRIEELAGKGKITAPLKVEKAIPSPGADFTDTARLKVCLDVEINLLVNGQKIRVS